MTQAPPAVVKIPTESPQPVPREVGEALGEGEEGPARRPEPRSSRAGTAARPPAAAARSSSWSAGSRCTRPASEGGRWRAVWHEDGQRQQCEAATEEKLAAKLEKVKVRLEADAPKMRQAGRRPHRPLPGPRPAPGQRAVVAQARAHPAAGCAQRFAAPVIGAVTCQDIKTGHMQQIVNAAPTAGEGDRVRRMISALVTAGIDAGYLVNSRLAKVHWQAGDRPLPAPAVSVAGESAQWVDPAEIPSDGDIARLGRALAAGVHGDRDELMANTAAYSGLRWGELIALTDRAGRPGRPRHHRRPQGGRSRRAPVPRGAEEPQAPQDDLPPPHPGRLPARRAARRPDRGRPAPSRRPAPTRSGWSSRPLGASTGGRPTSAAASSSPPTWPPAGATRTATARGPGTACGTCSAPRRCSPGSSTRPTCPGWPGTPTTASRWTCTSAPPPASSTAPAPLPSNPSRP